MLPISSMPECTVKEDRIRLKKDMEQQEIISYLKLGNRLGKSFLCCTCAFRNGSLSTNLCKSISDKLFLIFIYDSGPAVSV
jgi:hypothetical protein